MSLLKKISNIASDAADAAKEAGGKIADTCKYSAEKVSELKDSAVKAVSEKSEGFAKYFSESGFQEKLAKVGKKIGSTLAYPVILLYTALTSETTPLKYKSIITACLGYFILPADFIPDIVPGLGFSDDAAAIMACLAAIKHILTPGIYQEAGRRIESIFGEVNKEELEKIAATTVKLIKNDSEN